MPREVTAMQQTPETMLAAAAATLERAKRAIDAEIRAYPRPISGCDAQFNHLLAQRQVAHDALLALRAEPVMQTSRHPDPAI
jgi:hypothetical protein